MKLSNWGKRLIYPQGKTGVAVSILAMLMTVALANLAAYVYMAFQPPDIGLKDLKWGWSFRPIPDFAGIRTITEPVDTLLLGDSTCDKNLAAGPFADRLGGQVMNLGNINESSLLMDAWMLANYVERFGPPRNVILSRSSPWGFGVKHNVDFMAVVPLPWAYWDRYGLVPSWQVGELRQLLITRYGVLYSDADILRDRFLKPWNMFQYSIKPVLPSHEYNRGSRDPQGVMDAGKRLPGFYFDNFSPSEDATKALYFMSNLARSRHFQLYLTFQPEWDEAIKAGARSAILNVQISYLRLFIDPIYVHLVQDENLTFRKDQMESPNHLYPGAERILTEADIEMISGIQNQLTASQSQPLDMEGIELDKSPYEAQDRLAVTLTVKNKGQQNLTGSVSCLVRPAGKPDREWVARAPAVSISLAPGSKSPISLEVSAGSLEKPGAYDLIIFLRQNVGRLSHEIRVQILNRIEVK